MRVLLTGADGFIGKNLRVALAELDRFELLPVTRATDDATLSSLIGKADIVIHLAGVNRPPDPADFISGNADFTRQLCGLLAETGRPLPIVFASSIQAVLDNPYGQSKRLAEQHIEQYAQDTSATAAIYRLPNVFGKWCRPNYNSAVATFCHQISRGEAVRIHDPAAVVRLVYIDDVVAAFIRFLDDPAAHSGFVEVDPVYSTSVGELVDQIQAFNRVRTELVSERVGEGFERALYATYVSYLPTEAFHYAVPKHGDHRGVFVEMLKTKDSGQFSFFTAHPGVTRGGHYHHTKTEKFLVIKGRATFRFRHILTDETFALETEGEDPVIVETVPGWAHDVTNIGEEELVVMLWANEIFDREHPDTVACKVHA